MKENKFYAVLTGDVVGSSKLDINQRTKLLMLLKSSFNQINSITGSNIVYSPLEIFRGDSFQGVLSKPEFALLTSIVIRANIRSEFKLSRQDSIDAIIFKWTDKQAEAISAKFLGLNQEQIANRLNIKQSSINERLENAGSEAIYSLEKQFIKKIQYRVAAL